MILRWADWCDEHGTPPMPDAAAAGHAGEVITGDNADQMVGGSAYRPYARVSPAVIVLVSSSQRTRKSYAPGSKNSSGPTTRTNVERPDSVMVTGSVRQKSGRSGVSPETRTSTLSVVVSDGIPSMLTTSASSVVHGN